jgi:hypothetical protein
MVSLGPNSCLPLPPSCFLGPNSCLFPPAVFLSALSQTLLLLHRPCRHIDDLTGPKVFNRVHGRWERRNPDSRKGAEADWERDYCPRRMAATAMRVSNALMSSRPMSVLRFMYFPFPLSRRLLFSRRSLKTKRRERERRAKGCHGRQSERNVRGRDSLPVGWRGLCSRSSEERQRARARAGAVT